VAPLTPPVAPAGEAAQAGTESPPGVIAFYRVLAAPITGRLAGGRGAVVVELGLIAAYVLLRSADAPREWLAAWVAAAAILALVHPGSALTVFPVMAVFSEPFVLTRDLGAKAIVVAALALGLALRLVRRPREMPWSLSLALALLVAAGTLIGVGHVAWRMDDVAAREALLQWVAGPAAMAIVLVTAVWAARDGALRPLVAVTIAGVVAGFASLADFVDAASIRGTPLDWLVRPTRFELRLSGVVSSPNGTAALVIGPFAVCAAAAVLGRSLPVAARALAAGGVAVLAATMYFTYSRAALLGIFVVAVVIAWRIRRWLGAGLLVAGIVVGALLLPGYLASRSAAVGGEGTVDPNGVMVASDVLRLRAWAAAGAMWADNPLLGVGFGQYGGIADAYGDTALNSPHNEWLRFFAEGGVVVGILGVLWIIATLVRLARVPGWLGAGALGTALGWGVAATFNNPLLFIQVSTVSFTIIGTGLAWRAPPAVSAAPPAAGDAAESPPAAAPPA
jgi:O-antigen ligase